MNAHQQVDEPYPGLRSFRRDETHIFFGRENTINDMVQRLAAHRFLAVTGSSGSGKSSLVRTGLLDALDRGLLAAAGADWRVADFRPGRRPLTELAEALIRGVGIPNSEHETLRVEAMLARGPLGLVEWLKGTELKPQTSILLLADQFEEIFRFRQGEAGNDIDAFVALLLASARQREWPIYVVITMRSDFLGECAQFTGLAECINDGQYLTPRLTREQCEQAIEGPAAVFGGRVEKTLVNRLLNDMGTNADQLPLVQHVLMRLWRMAGEKDNGEGRVLTLDDYETLGGIGTNQTWQSAADLDVATVGARPLNALSAHADEILSGLNEEQRRLATIVFRALTESQGVGGRDVRRGLTLNELAEIADVPPARLVPVVDAFRAPGRNLLMPPLSSEPLSYNRIIEISHESLIRQWGTLRQWLRDEYDAAHTYRNIETNAKLWQQGNAALLSMPYLGVALAWRDREHPNARWAARYGDSFALAMKYLKQSHEAYRQRIEADEAARRKSVLRTRMVAATMAVLFLIASSLAYYGYSKRWEAEAARVEADAARVEAVTAKENAVAMSQDAERARDNAAKKAAEAEAAEAMARRMSEQASKERDRTEQALHVITSVQGALLFDLREEMQLALSAESMTKILDKLIQGYDEAIRIDSNNAGTFNARGVTWNFKKEFDKAIADYDKAIVLAPADSAIYSNRGIAWRSKGEYDRAISDLSEAIRLDRNNFRAYSTRGATFRVLGDHERAIADYSEAIRIDPKFGNAYQNRGYSYFYQGNFPAAAADLARALEIRTDPYVILWNYLSRRRMGQDNAPELDAKVAQLVAKKWPFAVIEFYLGRRSLAEMQAATTDNDEKCEADFYTGQWYLLQGNNAAAKTALQAAANTCPKTFIEFAGAQAELKRLNP